MLLMVASAFACGGEHAETETTLPDPAPSATASPDVAPAFLSAEAFIASSSEPNQVVLHVSRDDADYQAGHIPGAVYLPFSTIAEEQGGIPNELPADEQLAAAFEAVGVSTDSRVVLTGWPLGAARAWVALEALGLETQARILGGGTEAWVEAGGSLTTDVPNVVAGSIQANPTREAIVDAGWVAARLTTPAVAVVDARPLDQHTGETPGGGVERGGHIPESIHLYWEELRGPDGALLPVDVLEARFREAGIAAGDTVVAYCRTGVQASYLYAAARELGHPTKLYDASFVDWSARLDLPVKRGN